MRPLPQTHDAFVVRTDYGDERTWDAVRAEVTAPVGVMGFLANVMFVEDRSYDGATTEQIVALFGAVPSHSFVMIADRVTMTGLDHPLLVIDLFEDGGEFRAASRSIQAVENNLSLANMDFGEFVAAADDDGVFRDFRGP
jgi:hypothetical protein